MAAWYVLLYSDSFLLLPPRALVSLEIAHLFSTFTNVALGLLLVVLATRLTPLLQRRESLYIAGILGALATAAIPMTSAGLLPDFVFILCMVGGATAGLWLAIAWYEMLSTAGVQGTLLYLIIGTVLGLVLSGLISWLPVYPAICATVLLPLAAVICLRPVASEVLVSYPSSASRPSIKELLAAVPLRLIIVVGIISFTFGAVKTLQLLELSNLGPVGSFILTFMLEAVPFIIVGFIALPAYRSTTILAFYIAIPALALAALLLLFSDAIPPDIPYFIASVGTRLIRTLVLLFLVKTTLEKRVPLVFCIALLTVFEFVGTLIGQAITVITAGNTLVLAVVLLLMLIAAVLVLLGQRLTLAVEEFDGAAEAPGHDERVEQICSDYALSPRECEILHIWIQGHNSAYVERTLFISKNTVKTHLSHIYTKTGTGSREELLALLQGQEK
jgi:DNA-binding CsgD family transcriptional regulator